MRLQPVFRSRAKDFPYGSRPGSIVALMVCAALGSASLVRMALAQPAPSASLTPAATSAPATPKTPAVSPPPVAQAMNPAPSPPTTAPSQAAQPSPQKTASKAGVPDTIAQRTLACVACHGKEGRATQEGYFPRIAGKPAGYLYNQLINFREGRRTYPAMTYLVDHLSDSYLREIAEHFASLHPPYPPSQPNDIPPAVLERGRQLALSGDPSRDVPACIACHGKPLTGIAPAMPGLVGLPRDYLNAQFGAWKNGSRRAAAPDCMAQIAARLTIADISAVSGWLAAQPVPAEPAPLPSLPEPLPMKCGSMP